MAKKKQSVHYVNNKEFSWAVVAYCTDLKKAKEEGLPLPIVTNYIASCFLKISEGLSHKSNFIRYTYREEMVMDAVENCLKAIENYNIEAATRTGKPNAFAYFTQISWYAFLRRIEKEKKQQEIKLKYITSAGFEAYTAADNGDGGALNVINNLVDDLRGRIDKIRYVDEAVKTIAKEEKIRAKRAPKLSDEDSDLSDFMET
tara:strand:+ start:4142 stop:4747 length:606 start_codon:yes stop_codon:yes gene_type:complete